MAVSEYAKQRVRVILAKQGNWKSPSLAEYIEKTSGESFKLHRWQAEHLCPLLESLLTTKGRRILIHKPPQFGGSHVISKRFPSWTLGKSPLTRIALAGYNIEHASEFTRINRDLMQSSDYAAMFPHPDCRIPERCLADSFSTSARELLKDAQSSLSAFGLVTGFTGRGADILIVDDPYSSPEEARNSTNEKVWRWWTEQAKVRINDDTNVIVMFHRYHEDDLAGRLLGEGKWEYYRFPAFCDGEADDPTTSWRDVGDPLSEIRSVDFLREREESDPYIFYSMFQGKPRKPEGQKIKEEWFRYIGEAEIPPCSLWVRFWDLTSMQVKAKSDWTAGALVGLGPNQQIYIKDVIRFRKEWPDARAEIEKITTEDREWLNSKEFEWGEIPSYIVGVEKVFWQMPMIQDLFTRPSFDPSKNPDAVQLFPVEPKGRKNDKLLRALGWINRLQLGQVFLVNNSNWNAIYVSECLSFDGTEAVHDDMCDATSGAYNLIYTNRGELIEHDEAPRPGSINWWIEQAREQNKQPHDEEWNADEWEGWEEDGY